MRISEAEKVAVLRTRLRNGSTVSTKAIDLLLDLNEAGAIPESFQERFVEVAALFERNRGTG